MDGCFGDEERIQVHVRPGPRASIVDDIVELVTGDVPTFMILISLVFFVILFAFYRRFKKDKKIDKL